MSMHDKRPRGAHEHRLRRMRERELKPSHEQNDETRPPGVVQCGWGRVLFAHTFETAKDIAEAMRAERPEQRDIAFYVRDPHVVLAAAPQELFLDPSHSYRLQLSTYRASRRKTHGFLVRRLSPQSDAGAVNMIYSARGMVAVDPDFFWSLRNERHITVLVAEDEETGEILGTVTGIDHARAFGDPESGSSLWCLAVDPQARQPGIGEALVRRLIEHYSARGAATLDLSVLHDNAEAVALYEKLGFRRMPFYAVKRRNQINEKLFAGPVTTEKLNPYAGIIIDEARKRGIHVDVTDAQGGFFRLSYGGRSIHCRESLSELTTGVAMSICDDKAVTRRIVSGTGVKVPEQILCSDDEAAGEFLARHGSVVVKPARGEQGRGVAVGLTTMQEIDEAVATARQFSDRVLIEDCFEGEDLRLIVIDFKVVAAALRRPARIVGDGKAAIRTLIEAQSRRRGAATGGESTIPLDRETERCIVNAGFGFDDILDSGKELMVRKTANLHTGGTIHDVTNETHPELINAAVAAAQAIDIPVTGIDLMVRNHRQSDYVFIEANERPGLANHEPQPTAERFIDLLFPMSVPAAVRAAGR
jgi:GNAT-family acetyltransferase (TIGR03103 family)